MKFIWNLLKNHLFNSTNRNIAFLLVIVLFSLYLQASVSKSYNAEYFQANIFIKQNKAEEAFPVKKNYRIIIPEDQKKSYFGGEEIDKEVFKFGLKSYNQSLEFDMLTLHAQGNVKNTSFSEFILFEVKTNEEGIEEEHQISKSRIRNEKLIFRGFNSHIPSSDQKDFIIKASSTIDPQIGDHFTLTMKSSRDLSVKINNIPVQSLARYPVQSPSITVVGYRK
jgi:hypothetical protein